MKKRQYEKIMNLYIEDPVDDDFLIPPSMYRKDSREMEVFRSKAWRITNPEKAKEIDKAIADAIKEAQAKLDK